VEPTIAEIYAAQRAQGYTDEQIAAFVGGYAGVRSLPEYSEADMELLLLQRRIVLFNSLLQTTHPEDREMIPEYRAETMRRITDVLSHL
jgi:Ser/Thr protein kinase RdoA (MazF antagonist)